MIHILDHDLLGQEFNDRVVTLGSGVDGTVQRIGRTYDVRGMLQNVTSYSSPTIGTGTVVNDVQRGYNSFERIAEYQEHNGAVNSSTSPKVGYDYADGSANTIRQTGLGYPNGRLLTMDYGPAGGIDDALSRVASLIDNDGVTHLVDYTRIGTDTFVQAASPQPQIAWSLINGAGIDPYTGLDQFNRVVDNRWFNTTTSADLDRIQHGYDRAGNRLWRKNTVAEVAGSYLDELYAYDGLNRLARLDRGELDGTNTGIVAGTEDFTQAWGLDTTGNWSTFDQADTGGAWTLEQTRTSNTVNEITGITGGGWVVPAYDAAGNMITTPQPAAPTAGFTGVYDAWNRLISLSAGGSPVGGYLYDGLKRRVSKLVSGVLRDIFYTSAWQAIEERVGGSTTPDRQFVRGLRYIDDLVLRDRGTERLFGIQDPNWNMAALADITGAIQERYGYAAYGLPTVLSAAFAFRGISSYDWETRFAGYHWDAESGLYHVRHRMLSALLGVWTVRDPISREVTETDAYWLIEAPFDSAGEQSEEGERLYLYVGNRVTGAVDPSGLKPCGMFLCCGTINTPSGPFQCPEGGPYAGQIPCHCFIRAGTKSGGTDYHGWMGDPSDSCCDKAGKPGQPILKCPPADKKKEFENKLSGVACHPLGQATDCDALTTCLDGLVNECNNKPLCYGFCDKPNSNTIAYRFATSCRKLLKTPKPFPVKAPKVCPVAGASGWGPYSPPQPPVVGNGGG